jgi:rare lipoprotein A (peptidoglycan hydrolase)
MAVLSTGVAALAVPAAVVPAATDAQGPTPAPEQQPADQQDQSAKLHVKTRKHARIGSAVPVKGSISTGEAGRDILVQRASRRGWKTVARTNTRADGRFVAKWRTRNAGRYEVRVRTAGSEVPARRVGGKVNVYRPASASWYGPGLYGNKLACGGTLTPSTLGVAHKSLPCGTKVALRYRGRSVTVPVIDRGPYVAGREYDLTAATKNRLRFGSTGTVGSSK